MPDENATAPRKQLLTGFIVVLLVFAVGLVLLGEYAVAGVTFVGLTFVIYLRESL